MSEPVKTADELVEWMVNTVREDIESIIPKVMEYGATDLEALGVTLFPDGEPGGQIAAGCAFYLMGKAARAAAAYREGREASEDTWKDITVYSLMGRFGIEHGYWGVALDRAEYEESKPLKCGYVSPEGYGPCIQPNPHFGDRHLDASGRAFR
jgi:hypothetical protein